MHDAAIASPSAAQSKSKSSVSLLPGSAGCCSAAASLSKVLSLKPQVGPAPKDSVGAEWMMLHTCGRAGARRGRRRQY